MENNFKINEGKKYSHILTFLRGNRHLQQIINTKEQVINSNEWNTLTVELFGKTSMDWVLINSLVIDNLIKE